MQKAHLIPLQLFLSWMSGAAVMLTELCISRNEPGIISETYDIGQSNLILTIRLHKLQTKVVASNITDGNVNGFSV